MNQKKNYAHPCMTFHAIEAETPLQGSTGANIPDAGWGAKEREFLREQELQQQESNNNNLW